MLREALVPAFRSTGGWTLLRRSAEDSPVNRSCSAAAASHSGRVRRTNEDAYAFYLNDRDGSGDFVVCDGMGGAAAGDVASRLAASTMIEAMRTGAMNGEQLERAVGAANASVFSRAEQDPAVTGMGTTLTALAIRGERGWVAQVGDSRCYRFRSQKLELLTQDHSLLKEQLRLGLITPRQAIFSPLRHVITRAIGTHDHVTADISELDILLNDFYLLASDGLTNEVDDDEIANILGSAPEPCAALIDAACQAGGRDNITCVLVRIVNPGS